MSRKYTELGFSEYETGSEEEDLTLTTGRLRDDWPESDSYLSPPPVTGKPPAGRLPSPPDSLSSIRSSERALDPEDTREVYQELQAISLKLKQELELVADREKKVKQTEALLVQERTHFNAIVQQQLAQAIADKEQAYKTIINEVQESLKDKVQENKRLRDNFDTLKVTNDALKKELERLQQQHDKLDKQSVSLQARLANLQRKQDYEEKKEQDLNQLRTVQKQSQPKKQAQPKQSSVSKANNSKVMEVLGLALGWVSEVHLSQLMTTHPSIPLQAFSSPAYMQDKLVQVMPRLVEVLRESAGCSEDVSIACLEFTHWGLLHLNSHQHTYQKVPLSTTLRRLGEELLRPRSVRFSETEEDSMVQHDGGASALPSLLKQSTQIAMFKSSNLQIRFLCSLVILQTLNQADQILSVLESLRVDLKGEEARTLFLSYCATPVLLNHLKPNNKALAGAVVDILLTMSMDSHCLGGFLDACSTEPWFRSVTSLLKNPNTDVKILEKISIILQKLSKFKKNQRYFEVNGVVDFCQKQLRTSSTSGDYAFLCLNLKSIMFNLGLPKLPSC